LVDETLMLGLPRGHEIPWDPEFPPPPPEKTPHASIGSAPTAPGWPRWAPRAPWLTAPGFIVVGPLPPWGPPPPAPCRSPRENHRPVFFPIDPPSADGHRPPPPRATKVEQESRTAPRWPSRTNPSLLRRPILAGNFPTNCGRPPSPRFGKPESPSAGVTLVFCGLRKGAPDGPGMSSPYKISEQLLCPRNPGTRLSQGCRSSKSFYPRSPLKHLLPRP